MRYLKGIVCAITFCVLLMLCSARAIFAQSEMTVSSPSGVSVEVDGGTGEYRISASHPYWSFSGTLTSSASDIHSISGHDRIGVYKELTFTWEDGSVPLKGTIRLYRKHALILFRYKFLKAANPEPISFPSFTSMPAHLYHFSYQNGPFAPPQFKLGQYGTPWLLFDGNDNAAVISPASHFIIAAMHGDGDHLVASGLNNKLQEVPEGFTQQTLMAISPGIRHTFDQWGSALIALGDKKRPGNESDTILKYYGYWTDNGAAYYYRFDSKLGYAGTLKAVIRRYRKEKIPVRYLQLDSWWYDKSYSGMNPNDKTGSWKGGGGIMRFRADSSLFPHGLDVFDKEIGGLPLVVHSRWISQKSPYRKTFQISGIAPVGEKWWNAATQYLESNGVVTYEQDWQSRITPDSPAFSSTVHTGDDFYNHMANSCQAHHLTMQYCMALPSDFLEGSRYGNLTSIRASDDRFSRPRWRNFIYTSQLAYSIGTWPWTDVYFSHETNNMLIDTLSAGPVGTGDELGAEDKKNIMMAVRGDGVIVKPDVPLRPIDRMYIDDARAALSKHEGQHHGEFPSLGATPFVASTWTTDGEVRTCYVFAFSRSPTVYQTVEFSPKEVGTNSPVWVYDLFSHVVRHVGQGKDFRAMIGPGETGYYIVAPIGRSGIALFGDKGKFASMGKERIESLKESLHSVTAQVLFADGDKSVTLFGDAPIKPSVSVEGGNAGMVLFHPQNGMFSVQVTPDSTDHSVLVRGSRVIRVNVKITEVTKKG